MLASLAPVTFEGEFYKVDKLKMTPPLSAELFPWHLHFWVVCRRNRVR
jgi:hypothetical protein